MVDALVKEEQELAGAAKKSPASRSGQETNTTGPCFEYLLQESVLDRLCALGIPDRPPGMRELVTKTLDAIFLHCDHPILPTMSIHLAVKQVGILCVF